MNVKTASALEQAALERARDQFVGQWGAIGSAWGINRTMAQIHALLLVSQRPLSTDDVMEALAVSRGNAHKNLRELVDWGLIRSVIKKGDRKEYFEAEKDVWSIFCTIARERKRREIDPALQVLAQCESQTQDLKTQDAKAFHRQIRDLREFLSLGDRLVSRVATEGQSKTVSWIRRFIT